MTEEQEKILLEITTILEDIIDKGKVTLTPDTNARQVNGWDSLNHIQILSAIEKKYKFRFTLEEVRGFAKVGNMIDCIIKKISN